MSLTVRGYPSADSFRDIDRQTVEEGGGTRTLPVTSLPPEKRGRCPLPSPRRNAASDYSISIHPGLDGRHVHFRESDFSDNYAAHRHPEFVGCVSYPTEKGDAFPRLEEGIAPINTSWDIDRQTVEEGGGTRTLPVTSLPGETRTLPITIPPRRNAASDYSISIHPGLDGRHVHFRESDFSDNYAAHRHPVRGSHTNSWNRGFQRYNRNGTLNSRGESRI
ncbi:hypothetical protein TNCV_4800661 [Trichonephila clavipes]|nr:hypothetical protein TNCV_4800661 [Trichonephila clavipes]